MLDADPHRYSDQVPKTKNRIRAHTIDIYGFDLYLATTPAEWKRLRKYLGGNKCPLPSEPPDDCLAQTRFLTFEPHDGTASTPVIVFWVNVKKHRTTGSLVRTLAHEAHHGTGELLDHIGHHPHEQGDEPGAYLAGWLTHWLWDEIKETPHD